MLKHRSDFRFIYKHLKRFSEYLMFDTHAATELSFQARFQPFLYFSIILKAPISQKPIRSFRSFIRSCIELITTMV